MAATRARNAKTSFEIHHDEHDLERSQDETEELAESEAEQDLDQDEEVDNDGYSDSGESDDYVEPSVLEDMEKFQQSFKGIKERFRLINRIGEGM
jgi:cell division control protein 7